MEQLRQIPQTESNLRLSKIKGQLVAEGISAALITNNANKYYICGRIFNGYVYLPTDGEPIYFVRRPVELEGTNVVYINKPEAIVDMLDKQGVKHPDVFGLELDVTAYSSVTRLSSIFPDTRIANASPSLRRARATKTPYEIDLLKQSGVKHEHVYRHIPQLYKRGMTDLELQIEIERKSRLEECLGIFRISGDSMEFFMGNVICGENADNPTPYDFAMGGEGLSPALPIGCNGSEIKNGMTVMVDVNGNYTGYMTDMTRVFSLGNVDDLALKAHQCSIRIAKELSQLGKPGVEAKKLYERAIEIVTAENLSHLFMGHRQQAGFIGHGVGIEVNELPIISPRSSDILAEGNVIALEPKFVIPQIGAVGIENTYIVTPNGMVSITKAPEEIIGLD